MFTETDVTFHFVFKYISNTFLMTSNNYLIIESQLSPFRRKLIEIILGLRVSQMPEVMNVLLKHKKIISKLLSKVQINV